MTAICHRIKAIECKTYFVSALNYSVERVKFLIKMITNVNGERLIRL